MTMRITGSHGDHHGRLPRPRPGARPHSGRGGLDPDHRRPGQRSPGERPRGASRIHARNRHPRRRYRPGTSRGSRRGGTRGRRRRRARQQRQHPRPEPPAGVAGLPARRVRTGLPEQCGRTTRACSGAPQRTETTGAHYQRHERRRRRAVRRLGRIRVEQGRTGTALQHPRGRESRAARLPGRPRRHADPDAPGGFPRRRHQRPATPGRERSWVPRTLDGRPCRADATRPARWPRGWETPRTHRRRGPDCQAHSQKLWKAIDTFPDYPEAGSPLQFELPPELEAGEPPEARGLRRDEVRLMVSYLDDDSVIHSRFGDLPEFLEGRRHPRHQHQRHYERRSPRRAQ